MEQTPNMFDAPPAQTPSPETGAKELSKERQQVFQLIQIEPILQQMDNAVPKMAKGMNNAVITLRKYTKIESDEDREEVASMIGAGVTTVEQIQELRMPITKQFDTLKGHLMQYEKNVQAEVDRCRKVISDYDQLKIEERKKKEEEARKIKEKEDYKVKIATDIRQNIANIISVRVREINEGAKKYFESITLENYDTKAKEFNSFRPTLKAEAYEKCFNIPYDAGKLSAEEFRTIQEKVNSEEGYEKWRDKVIAELTPILSDKKAELPARKEELVKLANAKDEAEKKRLQEEAENKQRLQDERNKQQVQALEQEAQAVIDQRADVELMGNSLQEQAILQQNSSETGPTQLIGKFTDAVPVKALCEIIMNCVMHPKFKGIQKKSKDGQPSVDEHGFPIYIDGIQPWVDFYVANFKDRKVDGFETKEVPKVRISRR